MIEKNGPKTIPFFNMKGKAVEGEILDQNKILTAYSNNNNFRESKRSFWTRAFKKKIPPLEETWPKKIMKLVNKIASAADLHEQEKKTLATIFFKV